MVGAVLIREHYYCAVLAVAAAAAAAAYYYTYTTPSVVKKNIYHSCFLKNLTLTKYIDKILINIYGI